MPPIALPFQIPELTVPAEILLAIIALAKFAVPVNVGESESTKLPVPVEPVTSESDETRFASVIVEARFFEPSVVTKRDAVSPETVSDGVLSAPVDEILVVPVPPNASVLPERLVVDAVVKYDAPETESAVVEA